MQHQMYGNEIFIHAIYRFEITTKKNHMIFIDFSRLFSFSVKNEVYCGHRSDSFRFFFLQNSVCKASRDFKWLLISLSDKLIENTEVP